MAEPNQSNTPSVAATTAKKVATQITRFSVVHRLGSKTNRAVSGIFRARDSFAKTWILPLCKTVLLGAIGPACYAYASHRDHCDRQSKFIVEDAAQWHGKLSTEISQIFDDVHNDQTNTAVLKADRHALARVMTLVDRAYLVATLQWRVLDSWYQEAPTYPQVRTLQENEPLPHIERLALHNYSWPTKLVLSHPQGLQLLVTNPNSWTGLRLFVHRMKQISFLATQGKLHASFNQRNFTDEYQFWEKRSILLEKVQQVGIPPGGLSRLEKTAKSVIKKEPGACLHTASIEEAVDKLIVALDNELGNAQPRVALEFSLDNPIIWLVASSFLHAVHANFGRGD